MKYDLHNFWLRDKVNKNYNNTTYTIHILFGENKTIPIKIFVEEFFYFSTYSKHHVDNVL